MLGDIFKCQEENSIIHIYIWFVFRIQVDVEQQKETKVKGNIQEPEKEE